MTISILLTCLLASASIAATIWTSRIVWLLFKRYGIPTWVAFSGNCVLAVSLQVINDLLDGYFSQQPSREGALNALRLVRFEQSHGLFVEPVWQRFFVHSPHILLVTMSWNVVAPAMARFYLAGHAFITLGFALWLWLYRRSWFPLVRNAFFITNLFALIVYVRFPCAPPRLTSGLTWRGHPFVFQDPLDAMVNSSRLHPHFNEFSAVPSMHIGWASIVAAALVLLGGRWWVRCLGALYPALVLVVIVVTGNHYILDAIAGAGCAALAAVVALGVEFPRRRLRHWLAQRMRSLRAEPDDRLLPRQAPGRERGPIPV